VPVRWPAATRGPLAKCGHDEEASRDGDTPTPVSSTARALACMQGGGGRCRRAVGWTEEAQKREQWWLGEALPFSNGSHAAAFRRTAKARERRERGRGSGEVREGAQASALEGAGAQGHAA
jgi:hypothetical protein